MTLKNLQQLHEDQRVWTVAGRVRLRDGETEHWFVMDEGGVAVSVETSQHGSPIWAQLRGGSDDGSGVWAIPDVGTEVILAFDNGDYEGDCYVIAAFGGAPIGLIPGRVLIIGDNVEIRRRDGVAEKLPTMADHQALIDYIQNDLVLGVVGGGGGTATVATSTAPTPSGTVHKMQ